MTEEIVREYFDNLGREMDGVPAGNIINYDETNFTDDPGSVKVTKFSPTVHDKYFFYFTLFQSLMCFKSLEDVGTAKR